MTRFLTTICLVCMFALLTPAFAFGTLLVYDGFDYTAGESMDGQDGGIGWDSGWDVTAVSGGYATVQEASLVDGYGSYFTASGATNAGTATTMVREFDQGLTGTIYVSYLGVSNNSTVRRFALNLGQIDENGAFSYERSNWIGQINSPLGICYPDPPTDEPYWGVAYSADCSYSDVLATELSLIVAAVDIDNGHIDLYVLDPDEAYPTSLPLTPDASKDFGGSLGTINGVRYFFNGKYGTNIANASIDELKIGTTWADVVPVPEPSTLALFGTGLIGLLAYAWRKRK